MLRGKKHNVTRVMVKQVRNMARKESAQLSKYFKSFEIHYTTLISLRVKVSWLNTREVDGLVYQNGSHYSSEYYI